jgi:hypothetical protein
VRLPNVGGGVWKEIAFPIDLDKKNNKFGIGCIGIKINGILFDRPDNKSDYDLWARLGFSKEKPDDVKKQ